MLVKEEKEFKNFVKELPCLSCIIKPICFRPEGPLAKIKVKEPCGNLREWVKREEYFRLAFVTKRQIFNEVLKGAKRNEKNI